MAVLQQIVLWIHLVAAVTWVGGIIFLTFTSSVVRSYQSQQASEIFRSMGRRFRNISWAAVAILLITGILNLSFMGSTANILAFLERYPPFTVKMILVAVMIVVKALHDFLVGPRASANVETKGLWWRSAVQLGRLNLVLGLVVLFLALRIGK